MRAVLSTKQFKKDVKLASKRRRDLSKLKTIVTRLVKGEVLGIKFKDHKLVGGLCRAQRMSY